MEEGMEIQKRAQKEIDDQKSGEKREEKLELVDYRDGDLNPGSARDPIFSDGAWLSPHDKDSRRLDNAYASNNAYTTARDGEDQRL